MVTDQNTSLIRRVESLREELPSRFDLRVSQCRQLLTAAFASRDLAAVRFEIQRLAESTERILAVLAGLAGVLSASPIAAPRVAVSASEMENAVDKLFETGAKRWAYLTKGGKMRESAKQANAMADPQAQATLPSSCRVVGDVSASSDMSIDGLVEGNVAAPGHRLAIAKGGRIQGQVRAAEILVHGELVGSACGSARISVGATGTLRGPARAPKLALEEGALFVGSYSDEAETADPNAVAEIDQALRSMLEPGRR